jgi:hypothetical protein
LSEELICATVHTADQWYETSLRCDFLCPLNALANNYHGDWPHSRHVATDTCLNMTLIGHIQMKWLHELHMFVVRNNNAQLHLVSLELHMFVVRNNNAQLHLISLELHSNLLP